MKLSFLEIVLVSLLLAGPWLVLILVVLGLKRRLDARMGTAGDEVAAKVRTAVVDAVDEALPRVRDEVARGVRDAADEALPRIREQVREGVSEAIASAVTGGMIGKAGEELVRRGGGVLDALLGAKGEDE